MPIDECTYARLPKNSELIKHSNVDLKRLIDNCNCIFIEQHSELKINRINFQFINFHAHVPLSRNCRRSRSISITKTFRTQCISSIRRRNKKNTFGTQETLFVFAKFSLINLNFPRKVLRNLVNSIKLYYYI